MRALVQESPNGLDARPILGVEIDGRSIILRQLALLPADSGKSGLVGSRRDRCNHRRRVLKKRPAAFSCSLGGGRRLCGGPYKKRVHRCTQGQRRRPAGAVLPFMYDQTAPCFCRAVAGVDYGHVGLLVERIERFIDGFYLAPRLPARVRGTRWSRPERANRPCGRPRVTSSSEFLTLTACTPLAVVGRGRPSIHLSFLTPGALLLAGTGTCTRHDGVSFSQVAGCC